MTKGGCHFRSSPSPVNSPVAVFPGNEYLVFSCFYDTLLLVGAVARRFYEHRNGLALISIVHTVP